MPEEKDDQSTSEGAERSEDPTPPSAADATPPERSPVVPEMKPAPPTAAELTPVDRRPAAVPDPSVTPIVSHRRTGDLAWALPGVLAAGGLVGFLLQAGDWGADAAGTLGLFFGIVSLIVAVMVARHSWPFTPGSALDTRVSPQSRFSRKARLRTLAALILIAFAAGGVLYTAQREPDPRTYLAGTLRIGYVEPGYVGWNSSPEENIGDGSPETRTGFEVVVARAIQAAFEDDIVEIEWVPLTTLDQRISALRGAWAGDQKPVDLVISNFSVTPARQESIDFAGPYFVDTQSVAVIDKNIISPSGLKLGKTCTPDGATGQKLLSGQGLSPLAAESVQKCFTLLLAGDVQGVSTDSAILRSYIARDSRLRGARLIGIPGGSERYGIGIPNNHPKLCGALNSALADFLELGWDDAYASELVKNGGLPAKDLNYHKPSRTLTCEPPEPWLKTY